VKRIVDAHEAKTRLSALIAAVEDGERTIIARDGKPAVELVPHRAEAIDRTPGVLASDPAWQEMRRMLGGVEALPRSSAW
jgi:prevent-host-death family protein